MRWISWERSLWVLRTPAKGKERRSPLWMGKKSAEVLVDFWRLVWRGRWTGVSRSPSHKLNLQPLSTFFLGASIEDTRRVYRTLGTGQNSWETSPMRPLTSQGKAYQRLETGQENWHSPTKALWAFPGSKVEELQDVPLKISRTSLRADQWPAEGWDQGRRTEINPFEVQQAFIRTSRNYLSKDRTKGKRKTSQSTRNERSGQRETLDIKIQQPGYKAERDSPRFRKLIFEA